MGIQFETVKQAAAGDCRAAEAVGRYALALSGKVSWSNFNGLSIEQREDLRAQGAMAISRSLAAYDPARAGLSTYCTMVALNAMRDLLKTEALMARKLQAAAEQMILPISSGRDYDQFIDRIVAAAVREFGRTSPEVAVLSLRWLGYGVAEIGRTLCKTTGAVHTILRRLQRWAVANRRLYLPVEAFCSEV